MKNKFHCFSCGKVLETPYGFRRKIKKSNIDEITKEILNDGNFIRIHGGYGSKFDETILILAVCDECIERGREYFIHEHNRLF